MIKYEQLYSFSDAKSIHLFPLTLENTLVNCVLKIHTFIRSNNRCYGHRLID